MSRSRRKTPITGITCAESEKDDKRRCARGVRRNNKIKVRKGEDILIEPKEFMNPWSMAKDGKSYRKVKDYPKLMRK